MLQSSRQIIAPSCQPQKGKMKKEEIEKTLKKIAQMLEDIQKKIDKLKQKYGRL